MKNSDHVCIPAKKDDNFHFNKPLVIAILSIILMGIITKETYQFQQFQKIITRDTVMLLHLKNIDRTLTRHIEIEDRKTGEMDKRLDTLEKEIQLAIANRWTVEQALLLDEQDKRWAEQTFEKK